MGGADEEDGAAAALLHAGEDELGHAESGEDVDVEHLTGGVGAAHAVGALQLLEGHGTGVGHADIVHEQADLALDVRELGLELAVQLGHVLAAKIGDHDAHARGLLGASRLGEDLLLGLLKLGGVAGNNGHVVAALAKLDGEALADAVAGAGHHSPLAKARGLGRRRKASPEDGDYHVKHVGSDARRGNEAGHHEQQGKRSELGIRASRRARDGHGRQNALKCAVERDHGLAGSNGHFGGLPEVPKERLVRPLGSIACRAEIERRQVSLHRRHLARGGSSMADRKPKISARGASTASPSAAATATPTMAPEADDAPVFYAKFGQRMPTPSPVRLGSS